MFYIRARRTTIIVVKYGHTAASMELAQQQCQPLAGTNIPRRWTTCASTDVGPATLDQIQCAGMRNNDNKVHIEHIFQGRSNHHPAVELR
jgi:hypothetical protein